MPSNHFGGDQGALVRVFLIATEMETDPGTEEMKRKGAFICRDVCDKVAYL